MGTISICFCRLFIRLSICAQAVSNGDDDDDDDDADALRQANADPQSGSMSNAFL